MTHFRLRSFIHEQSVAFVVVKRNHLVGKVCDDDAGASAAVVIGGIRAHAGGANHAVLSDDGRRILSGGDDNMLRLWDAASGEEIRKFKGHTSRVWHVALTTDGAIYARGWLCQASAVLAALAGAGRGEG